MKPKAILVFTDLDGTLLDHHSYSYEDAEEALTLIKRRLIPLILSTSKTAAEIEVLRSKLGLVQPCIVENGAGIIRMDGARHQFGAHRRSILGSLDQLRGLGFKFETFSDMGPEGIAKATGLDTESAVLANERDFSEPMLWHDSDTAWQRFTMQLKEHNLGFTRGGRFIHILGRNRRGELPNKALAMQWLAGHWPQPRIIIALGDGENDLDMLRAADIGVLVRSPVNDIQGEDLWQTSEIGPAGWNSAILEILQMEDLNG